MPAAPPRPRHPGVPPGRLRRGDRTGRTPRPPHPRLAHPRPALKGRAGRSGREAVSRGPFSTVPLVPRALCFCTE
ncbi:hypothetical protein F0U59_00315 [Archangium gephyra]|nr:hypothetical protein F0U59_00315 [Archangium gephyra]